MSKKPTLIHQESLKNPPKMALGPRLLDDTQKKKGLEAQAERHDRPAHPTYTGLRGLQKHPKLSWGRSHAGSAGTRTHAGLPAPQLSPR